MYLRMLRLVASVGATGVENAMLVIFPPVIVGVTWTLYVSLASGMCTDCTEPVYVPSRTVFCVTDGDGDDDADDDAVGDGDAVDAVGVGEDGRNGFTTAFAVTRAAFC